MIMQAQDPRQKVYWIRGAPEGVVSQRKRTRQNICDWLTESYQAPLTPPPGPPGQTEVGKHGERNTNFLR